MLLISIVGKLKVSELFFEVPKDYAKPDRGHIQLFARSVTRHEKPVIPLSKDEQLKKDQKPWFVYLQVSLLWIDTQKYKSCD